MKAYLRGTHTAKKVGGKNKLRVEVWEFTRGGTKSPSSYYFKYRGKWVSPLAIRLKWEWSWFSFSFRLMYSDAIQDLVYAKNPFLELIHKNPNWDGKYIPVPLVYPAKP